MDTLVNTKKREGLPKALWALTFSAFGIGTAEFIIIGLLPTIAKDLSVSVSSTALLVTLYALGVAIGGPIFTALTGKMERKKLLLGTIVIFALGNFIAVFAPGLLILLFSRIITGATHGVFMANATTIAGNIVPSNKKATAISLVFGGFLISTVIGVPLGTYIGMNWDWRTTFMAVSIWGIAGLILMAFFLPKQQHTENILKLKDQPKVLKNKALILVLLINILAYAGTFTLFTFISPLLLEVADLDANEISIVLLVLGLGVALGNVIGGRISNKKPSLILIFLLISHAIVLFILPLVITSQLGIFISLFFFGFFAYSNVPALQLLSIQLSERALPGSGNIAAALSVSAFNVGAALGAYTGGIVIDSSLTIKSTPWVGGLFVIVALILGIINWQRNKQYEG